MTGAIDPRGMSFFSHNGSNFIDKKSGAFLHHFPTKSSPQSYC